MGMNSGRYRPVHRHVGDGSSGDGENRVGHATPTPARLVADSMGDTFRPEAIQAQYQPYPHPQQQPMSSGPIVQGAYISSQSPSQYQTDQFQPGPIKTTSGFALSHEILMKIAELKSLMYQHSNVFPEPDVILQGARILALQGDSTFLDQQLQFLRNFDAITRPSGQSNNMVV
jgi:hypothetical protein